MEERDVIQQADPVQTEAPEEQAPEAAAPNLEELEKTLCQQKQEELLGEYQSLLEDLSSDSVSCTNEQIRISDEFSAESHDFDVALANVRSAIDQLKQAVGEAK